MAHLFNWIYSVAQFLDIEQIEISFFIICSVFYLLILIILTLLVIYINILIEICYFWHKISNPLNSHYDKMELDKCFYLQFYASTIAFAFALVLDFVLALSASSSSSSSSSLFTLFLLTFTYRRLVLLNTK